MGLVLIAAVVLAAFLWFGWKKPVLRLGEWRLGAGLLAIATFTGAAFVASRGGYLKGAILFAASLVLVWMARSKRPAPAASSSLTMAEARAMLGVEETATAADIKAAYARLIRRVHPDVGGASGLAAQLNAARDRLLKD
ncbi:MAG: J domain-containing protein [Caulobacteraceae bacterium]